MSCSIVPLDAPRRVGRAEALRVRQAEQPKGAPTTRAVRHNPDMERYGRETYGDRGADLYDDWHQDVPGTRDCVERLAELAGEGPVLELGIGTGRLALPLAERGLEVHGLDSSSAMLARLRAKPGGERVHASIGDMADIGIPGPFSLVFVAINTIYLLPSQEEQVRCFASVAHRLAEGGVFVVEAQLPDPDMFRQRQSLRVRRVTVDSVMLVAARFDPATQRMESQHVQIGREGVRLVPGVLRWAWPSELDLMARLAGLRLRERWGGWRRQPFTASSDWHVSVYELAS
ncbi:MAG TPA: methyltransferase domain-containing protein [Actinomycetes bacterium]|nr:methyltransferase domain-containing protein [Actinomycetes bacterium]